jgi:hypothetical protein
LRSTAGAVAANQPIPRSTATATAAYLRRRCRTRQARIASTATSVATNSIRSGLVNIHQIAVAARAAASAQDPFSSRSSKIASTSTPSVIERDSDKIM